MCWPKLSSTLVSKPQNHKIITTIWRSEVKFLMGTQNLFCVSRLWQDKKTSLSISLPSLPSLLFYLKKWYCNCLLFGRDTKGQQLKCWTLAPEVWVQTWQDTLLSHCLSPTGSIKGNCQIVWEAWSNAGELLWWIAVTQRG